MPRKPPLAPLKRTVPPGPAVPPPTRPFPPADTIALPGRGGEDVAVLADGGLLTGLETGELVRVDPRTRTATVLATTGGRPLGLETLPDGRVLVCDSHRGRLRLDPAAGTLETLATEVAGVPMRFCSNATVQRDGTIWFTESTTRFHFEHYVGSFFEHRPSGRLMRRDPSGDVEVVLDELWFANGIALLPDESALMYAETANYSLSRLPLTGGRAGRPEPVLTDLPGFPDNLSPYRSGRAWLALTNPRNALLDRLGRSPGWVRQALWRVPDSLQVQPAPIVWLVAVDEQGRIVEDLHVKRPDFWMATGIAEHEGRLWVASPQTSSLLCVDLGG